MSFEEKKEFYTAYIPLDENPNNSEYKKTTETNLIAQVLKNINSKSKNFEIKVMCIFSFVYFAYGMHIYSFVFPFISPEFTQRGNPDKSTRDF